MPHLYRETGTRGQRHMVERDSKGQEVIQSLKDAETVRVMQVSAVNSVG